MNGLEKKNERRRITCDHKFENVETGFEHYSYEMSEFKPNKPNTINLQRVGRRTRF